MPEFKEYHKNPRRLTEKQFKLLQRDIEELGDLGCIVHNLNTDEIISGNQRCKIIKPSESNIIITERFDPSTKTGTVALGYIVFQGERWPYRQVRWDDKTAAKAVIVANKAGGTWDMDALANDWDMDDLKLWGFEDWEFGIGKEDELPSEEPKPKLPKEPEIHTCPYCGKDFQEAE